jgi:hypothetical protein
VLELQAIACKKEEGGGLLAVAMTAQENKRCLLAIRDDYCHDCDHYYNMLGRVNAETSECSRPDDRASIHDGIRSSVGFAKLSRMVFGSMEGHIEEQLRVQAAASTATGDEMGAILWKAAEAKFLTQQGRSREAVVIYEDVLMFFRRVLPEDHPDIGEAYIAWTRRSLSGYGVL